MEFKDILISVLLSSCVKGQGLLSIKPDVFIEGQPGNVTCTYYNQPRTFIIYGSVSDTQSITTCSVQSQSPCVINSVRPDYSQYYNISNTTNSITIHINIVNRTRDGGQWRCFVYSSSGENKDNITIDVKVPVASVEITNKNIDLIKDSTVNLECKSTGGYPLPNITWTIDTRLLSSVNRTTSSLSYTPAVSDQGQIIQCLASNGYGPSQTDSFQLNIKYKPVVDIKPSITPYKLIQGQTVMLECHVNSNPVVTSYKWYNGSNIITGSSSTYTVSNDGSYSCSATNTVGESDRSRVISVEILYPPTVSTPKSPYSIIEFNTLTIPCIATSNPVPNSYTWSGPNNLLQSQQNLTIPSISRNQTGLYTCTVTNIMIPTTGGQQTSMVTDNTAVTVLSTPNLPSNITIQPPTSTICIEWTPGFNGGALQSFIVQHSTDDKTWVNSSTIPDDTNNGRVDYCIEGLKPDTSYYIRVIASNKYGESLTGMISMIESSNHPTRQATELDNSANCSKSINSGYTNSFNAGYNSGFGAGIGTGFGIAVALAVMVTTAIFIYRYWSGKRKKVDKTYDGFNTRTSSDDTQTYQELDTVHNTTRIQSDDGTNVGRNESNIDDSRPYANLNRVNTDTIQ